MAKLWICVLLASLVDVGIARAATPPEGSGKTEVRAAFVLLNDGVDILNQWADGLGTKSNPNDDRPFREACGRLTVSRDLLKTAKSSPDESVRETSENLTTAANLLARMIDLFLHPDTERNWQQEIVASGDAYDNLVEELPLWSRVGTNDAEVKAKYRSEVDAAIRKMISQGSCIPPKGLSDEEYRKKAEAWAARNAELDRRAAEVAAKRKAEEEQRGLKFREVSRGPEDAPAVMTWYKSVYQPKIGALKGAFLGFEVIDRRRRSQEVLARCTDLYSVTDTLLIDKKLRSGNAAIDAALPAVLKAFRAASEICLAGDMKKFNQAFTEAEGLFAPLDAALQPYHLQRWPAKN